MRVAGCATASLPTSHARDADTIVGDNGRIVRIVGINGIDARAGRRRRPALRHASTTTTTRRHRLRREREDRRPRRAPARLHAGRPGLPSRPVLRSGHAGPGRAATPARTRPASCSDAAADVRRALGTNTDARPIRRLAAYADIGGHDEIHGESGDDTVYTGCGNDVIFGDAQDDDLIGGWGNDWISGGTGQDGILGDDGRIFTSRNTGCTRPRNCRSHRASASRCTASARFLPTDPDTTGHPRQRAERVHLHAGPGADGDDQRRAARCKKEVDLTPFNLGPNTVAGHFQVDLPLFDANNSDDIIFGGWATTSCTAAPATTRSPAPRRCRRRTCSTSAAAGVADRPGPHRLDAAVQPAATCSSSAPTTTRGTRRSRSSRASASSPSTTSTTRGARSCSTRTGARGAARRSRTAATRARTNPPIAGREPVLPQLRRERGARGTSIGCGARAPNGDLHCSRTSTVSRATATTCIFGDLGNDWLVGGTGKDTISAAGATTCSTPTTSSPRTARSTTPPDTHARYEDRAYGGAGLDILIGNTGGDRLIDWVGEFNSYIVPFARSASPRSAARSSRSCPSSCTPCRPATAPTRRATTDTGAVVTGRRNGEPTASSA